MKMPRIATSGLCAVLWLAGCDNGRAEAEVAMAAAQASVAIVKAEAEAKAAEAAKQAAETAAKAFADKKSAAIQGLASQVTAFEQKTEQLKAQSDKLKGPRKQKADVALEALSRVKDALTTSLKAAEAATDATLTDLTQKVSANIEVVKTALDEFEAAVVGKKQG